MTVDWFVLLTPAVLLIVALPFLFVGCTSFSAAPAAPTVLHGPPLTITPTFSLEMDSTLQEQLPSKVIKIEVTWSLESSMIGGPAPIILPQPPPAVIRSTQAPPPATPPLDPSKDPGASTSIEPENVGTRDRVRCICAVFLANGTTGDVAGTTNAAVLKKDGAHQFRIQSRPPNRFRVYFNGA